MAFRIQVLRNLGLKYRIVASLLMVGYNRKLRVSKNFWFIFKRIQNRFLQSLTVLYDNIFKVMVFPSIYIYELKIYYNYGKVCFISLIVYISGQSFTLGPQRRYGLLISYLPSVTMQSIQN